MKSLKINPLIFKFFFFNYENNRDGPIFNLNNSNLFKTYCNLTLYNVTLSVLHRVNLFTKNKVS